MNAVQPVLQVDNLVAELRQGQHRDAVINGVSLALLPGQITALVGESGCGKSITAMAIMRLLPPNIAIAGGRVLFGGSDIAHMPAARLRAIRGKEIAMIFQDPMASLNPVMTVGRQIMEAMPVHPNKRAAALELLRRVAIPDPERAFATFAHRLSGGQRQRVMIAMALAGNPRVLIADEPTTALDVTIQAGILALLDTLCRELGLGILLISHNLAVVSHYAQTVTVMYAGRVMEAAPTADLFARPLHPYTRGLLGATPKAGLSARNGRLQEIPGLVPSPGDMPPGCPFAPRCPAAIAACEAAAPALAAFAPGHSVACIRPGVAA